METERQDHLPAGHVFSAQRTPADTIILKNSSMVVSAPPFRRGDLASMRTTGRTDLWRLGLLFFSRVFSFIGVDVTRIRFKEASSQVMSHLLTSRIFISVSSSS